MIVWLYGFFKSILGFFMPIFFTDIVVVGAEHIPMDGPLIVVG